jgi:hypothetical protein
MVGQGTGVFGNDLLPWLLLALGAAMVVGNVLALVRPPKDSNPPPLGRSLVFVALGTVVAIWSLASLL